MPFLMLPWWVKPLAVLALCAAVVGGISWWRASLKQEGARVERQRIEALADLQREANRSRARDASLALATRTQIVEKYLVVTEKEFRHATADLAACPVPDRARVMLNDAVRCARDGSPAACGSDAGLSDAR